MSQIKGNSTLTEIFNVLISALFSVITRRVVVISYDVSGQLIGPIFKGQESEEKVWNPISAWFIQGRVKALGR
jgi:hypothetical protein